MRWVTCIESKNGLDWFVSAPERDCFFEKKQWETFLLAGWAANQRPPLTREGLRELLDACKEGRTLRPDNNPQPTVMMLEKLEKCEFDDDQAR